MPAHPPHPGQFTIDLASEAETERLGAAIAASLHPGDTVGLDGPLGAGKTRLVRAIAIALGAEPALVHSPTYVLANEYPLERQPAHHRAPDLLRLIHVDAYRLTEDDDLAGIIDLTTIDQRAHADPDACVLIEWSDRIAHTLTDSPRGHDASPWTLAIALEHAAHGGRTARLKGPLAATVAERFARRPHEHPANDTIPADRHARTPRACRTCAAPITEDAPHFPFCSQRCQLVDFGKWMDGDYRISRDIKDSDLDADD
ncbi:MAG: tRNA (adenosine(37)-N6)-threonylcarbamoyltransferase complex ATPase subunit type 1 TsaE [Phycisphaerales bacterium]